MPGKSLDWSRDDANFAENMRRRREQMGWTQGELAKRLREAGLDNMHQTTVSRMEKGDRPPRVGEARGIATVLEVSLGWLIAPPVSVQVGDAIHADIRAVEEAYRGLTGAAEDLHTSRAALVDRIERTRSHEPESGTWYARNLHWLRWRARIALDRLTIEGAIADRGAPEEFTEFDAYQEASGFERWQEEHDGERPEAP